MSPLARPTVAALNCVPHFEAARNIVADEVLVHCTLCGETERLSGLWLLMVMHDKLRALERRLSEHLPEHNILDLDVARYCAQEGLS